MQQVYLEQQCDSSGNPITDFYLITQLVGVRMIHRQTGTDVATLGSSITGADVDQMLTNTGYDIFLNLESTYKRPTTPPGPGKEGNPYG